MKTQSGRIIHAGLNFLTLPVPLINSSKILGFQQAILSKGLEFSKVELPKNSVALYRDLPYPLQIRVSSLEPQMGQLLIVTPQPEGSLDLFISEVEAGIDAYEAVWPADNRQIVTCDVTIRELFETSSQHAFQELWENRLGQSAQALSVFGRPIRGGGLRFVMDPIQEGLPSRIEVKIESFLADTTKIFVETQFVWPVPTNPSSPFEANLRIDTVRRFINDNIIKFIEGERK